MSPVAEHFKGVEHKHKVSDKVCAASSEKLNMFQIGGSLCIFEQWSEFVEASRCGQTERRKNYHRQITFEIISGTRKNQ